MPKKNIVNRLGIYVVYDKDGIIDDYIPYFLNDLKQNLSHLVIVVNGKLSDEGRVKLECLTDDVYVRPNNGFDCGAYKFILLDILGWSKVYTYDELLLANDTVYGPIYPFETVFKKMDEQDVDFWGLTEQPESTLLSHMQGGAYTPRHIQSYFINIKKRLLLSSSFREFWEAINTDTLSFTNAIIMWELEFNTRFSKEGFSSAAYIDYSQNYTHYPKDNLNLTAEDVFGLVKHCRHPVLKRKALARDIAVVMKAFAGENVNAFLEYIDKSTNYNSGLIWQNLLRTSNILAIRDTFHINYVLSSRSSEKTLINKAQAVAVISASNMGFSIEKDERIKQLPQYLDVKVLPEKKCMFSSREFYDLYERYEFLCFIGDPELHDESIPSRSVISAMRMLWDNTLASDAYITNVLNTFKDNPQLGLLYAPQAYHSLYFSSYGADTPDKISATRTLAEHLGLNVPINPTYGRIPEISAFWCRPKALKPLFTSDTKLYNNPAIFGILPYVAQQMGYFSGIVMTENQAATRIIDLEHMLSGILFTFDAPKERKSYYDFTEHEKIEGRLIPFCRKYKEIFIVNVDSEAQRWADILDKNGIKFTGFIIMDGQIKERDSARRVAYLSEIAKHKDECGLILAMNYKNKGVVAPFLQREGFVNVLEIG